MCWRLHCGQKNVINVVKLLVVFRRKLSGEDDKVSIFWNMETGSPVKRFFESQKSVMNC